MCRLPDIRRQRLKHIGEVQGAEFILPRSYPAPPSLEGSISLLPSDSSELVTRWNYQKDKAMCRCHESLQCSAQGVIQGVAFIIP